MYRPEELKNFSPQELRSKDQEKIAGIRASQDRAEAVRKDRFVSPLLPVTSVFDAAEAQAGSIGLTVHQVLEEVIPERLNGTVTAHEMPADLQQSSPREPKLTNLQ